MQIVVVLTTSNEERDVVASYKLGANSYIRKPVDFRHFTKMVGELNHYWQGMNVPPPANG
jgi:two-component system response regulator